MQHTAAPLERQTSPTSNADALIFAKSLVKKKKKNTRDASRFANSQTRVMTIGQDVGNDAIVDRLTNHGVTLTSKTFTLHVV